MSYPVLFQIQHKGSSTQKKFMGGLMDFIFAQLNAFFLKFNSNIDL